MTGVRGVAGPGVAAPSVTRRRVTAGLAALGAGLAAPRRARADLAGLEAAARKEGSVTWYVAQLDSETAEQLGRTFTRRHPGVMVEVIRTTGQVAFQRLSLDLKNNTPHCDVFSATDISHMPILKDRGALLSYTPEAASGMLPTFRAMADSGWWYPTNAGRWVLIRNKDRVTLDAAPKAWADLLDAKWKRQVSIAHPAFSGGMGVWTLAMKQTYGWEFFEKLAKNEPRVGRSTLDTVTLLSAAECLVGPTWAPGAYRMLDKGAPIAIDQPRDGVVVMVFPSAIPASAPHPNAAKLFLEWMLSEEYSRLTAADGSEPIHAGAAARPDQPPLSAQKVIAPTVAEIRKGIPEVVEQWRDTFGA